MRAPPPLLLAAFLMLLAPPGAQAAPRGATTPPAPSQARPGQAEPVQAQPGQAQSVQAQPVQSNGNGAAPEPPLPADPATAAPQPPDLTQPPRPSEPLPQPSLPLARGMETLPGSGWRLSGSLARGLADAPSHAALTGIARWLADSTEGRVTIVAQVARPEDDVSLARRDSLAHGQAIRRILEQGGLDGTRIDIRPLGRTAEARDAIELLPPSARRAAGGTPPSSTQTQSQSRP
ncbi:hypothetical protein [Roseomonas sp. 18066]|uniref:hypothetical protein n=1 Tax=Roseomonas sp. 18066 TaxID=2681412 RepID=UPI00135C0106|nr:hypothetical protein [Roseomonas sp. 18066]